MRLLFPIGLLGLLGLLVWLIIYLIKPNYQQKTISSTYIWKLSLKYRKKNVPLSKLRNLLLIVCQLLALTSLAFVLAKPVKMIEKVTPKTEVICIIDSSASMRTRIGKENRFDRAVEEVKYFADEVLLQDGIVNVILADDTPSYYQSKITMKDRQTFRKDLDILVEDDLCSYGSSNIEEAVELCESVIMENPATKVYLYTDTKYEFIPEGIECISVTAEEEWNAAILNVSTEKIEGSYAIYVDLACYGKEYPLSVDVVVEGANAEDHNASGEKISFENITVLCSNDKTKRLVLSYANGETGGAEEDADVQMYNISADEKIFSYQSISVRISENDNLPEDNSFYIYGGQKPVLKVQYASADPNPFVPGALAVLKKNYTKWWDIQIDKVKKGDDAKNVGYDLYIYEDSFAVDISVMPEKMPTDGAVMLINPRTNPQGSGFQLVTTLDYVNREDLMPITQEAEHVVLEDVQADMVGVSRIQGIRFVDANYTSLWSCDNHSVLAVKNNKEEASQVMVMGFSLHFSNLSQVPAFYLLMDNMFNYFFPTTTKDVAFEVNENVEINCRGLELSIEHTDYDDLDAVLEEFPTYLQLTVPGHYILKYTTLYNPNPTQEHIFVALPSVESNIWAKEEILTAPYRETEEGESYDDWLLYVAALLVFALFAEWLLQQRDS